MWHLLLLVPAAAVPSLRHHKPPPLHEWSAFASSVAEKDVRARRSLTLALLDIPRTFPAPVHLNSQPPWTDVDLIQKCLQAC